MKVSVRHLIGSVCVCLCAITGLGLHAAPVAMERFDLGALEALTGRWIALRSQLAEEEQTWQRQQQYWHREIALLQKEIADRRAVLDTDTAFLSGVEEAQADIVAEKESMEAALRDLGAVVGRHEALLRDWEVRVPRGLLSELEVGLRALPANDAMAARLGVLRRLQTVLALYTQIESLQNNIHLVRELVDLNGSQREAEIVYLGMARGFAVSASDDWAAIGVPAPGGWKWHEHAGEAARIRLAIRVLQRDAVAQLVPLLLDVSLEGQP